MINYPQVKLGFMNRDHAEFSQLHTKLLRLLDSEATDAEVDKKLKKLAEHTRDHFAAEEQAMRDTQFISYPMHKEEHTQVLIDMLDRIERWHEKRDKAALKDYFKYALPAWLVHHVSTMDLVTAQYIVEQQQD